MKHAGTSEGDQAILADHKRVGKRFIPKLLQLGPLVETSWKEQGLAELLWLALLNEKHGVKRGAELAVKVAKAALETIHPERQLFVTISALGSLTSEQQASVVSALTKNDLWDIQSALADLVSFWPQCPLSFLFDVHERIVSSDSLSSFATLIAELFDKTSSKAMFAQAAGVYIGFACNMLFVKEGLALAQFPEIEHYPYTEKSREVGAAIRSTIVSLFMAPSSNNRVWPQYFWNRGLELSDCYFREGSDE